MKKVIPFIVCFLTFNCATIKHSGKEILNNNKDVEIVKAITRINNDSLYVNELRFHLSSALYTRKYMFKKFGLWDKAIKINKYDNYLIWNNCKFFDNKDDLYTIIASGVENRNEMYSSVMVRDINNIDLLSESSKLRDTLVNVFYNGVRKTTLSKDKFYDEYQKMRKKGK